MMTAALFTATALRLNPADLYEFQDAETGATQARLIEMARVRSPRGSFLTPDQVQTPRLTFAVRAPDGSTLMYADRAEHLKLNPIAPQMAFIGPDGTILGRLEYDSHSTFHGGGRVLGTTDQGLNLTPAARLLDANGRPFADLVFEQPPNLDRPTLPDGRDARTVRWTAPNGAHLAERRNGDLHIDNRVTGAWRALLIGSYLATAFEFHLPIANGDPTETPPEIYPGFTNVHTAYDDFQHRFVAEYSTPTRTRASSAVFRPGVQRAHLEHLYKLVFPIAVAIAAIVLVIRFLT
ncbi:hypothetical protein [Actinomadura chibensis]|uniref:Uncharacterized protein n=1 Tax=Actinomadura chibensis TaxID=392828 RepID=A0A5D0N943_9ACTN|nr:hypothetical protein [Actinomadura chibensis]TYB40869.1 hypothetical protein FXF69_38320 [Actinomadura chibensis]